MCNCSALVHIQFRRLYRIGFAHTHTHTYTEGETESSFHKSHQMHNFQLNYMKLFLIHTYSLTPPSSPSFHRKTISHYRYSGISEKTLHNVTRTLRDVQAVLLSMFNSKSILVGHSLESDFKALKLIHDLVVDTSILYPHKMGPPKKRALKTLCIENLKRIIQEDGNYLAFNLILLHNMHSFPHTFITMNLALIFGIFIFNIYLLHSYRWWS